MIRTLFVAAGVAAASAMPSTLFASWHAQHSSLSVVPGEYDMAARERVFHANLAVIEAHNAGNHSWTMGPNQFTDLTSEEFASYVHRSGLMEKPAARNEVVLPEVGAATVDWRTKGAVTPVKNQGQCGSCWAFSTTGSMEGAFQIATRALRSFSEQQLVDCDHVDKGCSGGIMDNGYAYILKNGGIDTESDYPYVSGHGKKETCKTANAKRIAGSIKGHVDVKKDNEAQLAAAVVVGPVSVAVEADKPAFQHYKGGVMSDPSCGVKLDHGVLVVGITADAYIVKNSWGPTWGEKGFIRIKRNGGTKAGLCGIASQPCYPTIAKGPAPPLPPPTPPGPSPGPPGPAPPAGKGHYEEPHPGCMADEQAVKITGLKGNFCSPSCKGGAACPTDVPMGTTAKPTCALETSGSSKPSQCALICIGATQAEADLKCPKGATCKKIQTTGICTYGDKFDPELFAKVATVAK